MKPRLSILIPCYRVEKYIRQCLDSIFAIKMSEGEYEVLCFDDQSPDNTLQILNEYAQKHNNMKLIRADANVGPGGGRNNLFAIAEGQYVWFVDGDDLIIPESVENLINITETNKLDVLVFNYIEWNSDKTKKETAYYMPNTTTDAGVELADKIFEGGLVNNMGYPVRFLIRREYLIENNISFPENMRYGEDTVWMAKVVLYAQRMMSTSIKAYIYWHHEDSTCGILSRIYPGRTIYEKCILTSHQLLEFVNDLRIRYDNTNEILFMKYADNIENFTSSHYINNLPIMLSRSIHKERSVFYNKFSNDKNTEEINIHANRLTRILLLPILGKYISEFVAFAYKITH